MLRSRSRKFWKGRNLNRRFHLRLRNPGQTHKDQPRTVLMTSWPIHSLFRTASAHNASGTLAPIRKVNVTFDGRKRNVAKVRVFLPKTLCKTLECTWLGFTVICPTTTTSCKSIHSPPFRGWKETVRSLVKVCIVKIFATAENPKGLRQSSITKCSC